MPLAEHANTTPAPAVLAAYAAVNQVHHFDLTDHVSDIRDQLCSCAPLPDAELISACREYLGCDRIASEAREGVTDPWEDRPAFKAQMGRLSDAIRERNRLLPQVLDLPAKTREGVAMKARVIAAFFTDKNGLRSAAVRSLTDDIAAVMGEQRS